MFALLSLGDSAALAGALRESGKPALQRRALTLLDQLATSPLTAERVEVIRGPATLRMAL